MNIQILANTLKFLERVSVSGNEAYAWCEAHQYLQSEINRLAQLQISSQSATQNTDG